MLHQTIITKSFSEMTCLQVKNKNLLALQDKNVYAMLTFFCFFRFREFDSHVTSQSPAKRVPTADSSKLSWSATELCSTAKCASSSGCYEQSTRCGLWPRTVPAYRGRCQWTGNLDRQQHFNVHPDDATPRSQESPPELLYAIKT